MHWPFGSKAEAAAPPPIRMALALRRQTVAGRPKV